jgi:antitoxin component of MazEF toxin-antitoxin module
MAKLLDQNTLTVLDNGKTTDITPKELKAIEKYKEQGLPGIAAVNEVVMAKALDLYLGGKTYTEISTTTSTKKEIILYLAHKFKWYETKMEQLEILDANIKERILHAKLTNQDFVLQIQQFFTRKIGRKMTKFLATNDEDEAAKVDRKDIEIYIKSVELLDKLSTEKTSHGNRPAVGLNLGDGVSIKKVGENEVVVTPRNKTAAEMLNELANLKRQMEEPQKVSNDIVVEGSIKNEKQEKEEDNESQ